MRPPFVRTNPRFVAFLFSGSGRAATIQLIIATGLFAQACVRDRLVVPGDAAVSAVNMGVTAAKTRETAERSSR